MTTGEHVAGKTIIVTGAAGGFGRILAEKTAAMGANVGACDIDGDGMADLAGDTILASVVDVTDLTAMRTFVAEVVGRFGRVDVVINNAGVMPLAFYADHERAAEAWSRCIDINIKGVLHGMIAAHDQMVEQGRGHVVNISSIYGNSPTGGAAVYGATKAAVNVMSDAFRIESQGRIKVTIVRPTGVPTTGLGGSIVNPRGVEGILGRNMDEYLGVLLGGASEDQQDRDRVEYAALAPEDMVEQILHAIDQPWGVTISDITVRATGDRYLI